ncbi:carboxypeptidase-like regulatory domain-containing protein, partial [bacterium]|nr:carboxypeptidase-like regulatory domain-containing protein [bacterium]
MKNLSTTFLLILTVFLTGKLYAQQPGSERGGNFDPSKLPKIGVLTGTLVDDKTQEPLAYAAVKVTHKMSEELVTGGMTNERGQFKIEGITLGPNVIEF